MSRARSQRRLARSARVALIGGCIALFGGCIDAQSTEPAPTRGDLADFAAFVQPVLTAGCASLDCHGDPGRPLRLYALHGLRLSASLRTTDASDDELLANVRAIDGLDPGVEQIENHLLLLKPLAVSAGGLHHIGGDLWTDQRDPAYRCLHAWLRAGASDTEGQAVCAEASPP